MLSDDIYDVGRWMNRAPMLVPAWIRIKKLLESGEHSDNKQMVSASQIARSLTDAIAEVSNDHLDRCVNILQEAIEQLHHL